MIGKILIVEDDPLQALATEIALGDAGYRVVGVAADPNQAIWYAKHRAPQVALIDYSLRGGTTGASLAKYLKARFDIIPLFVTGNPAALRASYAGELAHLLVKPYTRQSLLQETADALAERGHGVLPVHV